MSFVEVFYPGNQQKRENCVRLMENIYSAMKGNVDATNDVICVMHTHLKIQCDPLVFYQDKTVKENADNFVEKMKIIQTLLAGPLQSHQHKIDPRIYDSLSNDKLELSSIFDYLRRGGKTLEVVVHAVLLVKGVVQTIGNALTLLVNNLSMLWFGTFPISLLILGIDAIYSAYVGYKEKAMLEDTEAELQGVVDKLVPLSRKYVKEMNRLEFKMDDLLENTHT